MALMQDRLLAEASTAAWQDYFWFNALLAILSIFPALPCWRRTKYQAPTALQAAATPAHRAATPQASR
jgi:cytochrome c-type biogenesis protein CcmH/NrfG